MLYVPAKDVLLGHSLVSPSLIAEILFKKYVLHLPLYRLEADLRRQGLPLSRQTMANWSIDLSSDYLHPVYLYLMDILKRTPYQHCDETTIEVIMDGRKAGAKSYMWVHMTGQFSKDPPVIIYCYEHTRGTDHLRKFYLDSMRIILSCDAYGSYKTIAKEMPGTIDIAECWMHARRRAAFALRLRLLSDVAQDQLDTMPEMKMLIMIAAIYEQEEKVKNATARERLAYRQAHIRPLVDEYFDYIRTIDVKAPDVSEKLKDAVSYSLNQEEYLRVFLSDGMVPIDNGANERAIRPFAIGRRNWLFCFSKEGAYTSAVIYSLVETAIANNADPYLYLRYLFETMPGYMDGTDRSFLKEMTPWSETYRSYEAARRSERIAFRVPEPQLHPPEQRRSAPKKPVQAA